MFCRVARQIFIESLDKIASSQSVSSSNNATNFTPNSHYNLYLQCQIQCHLQCHIQRRLHRRLSYTYIKRLFALTFNISPKKYIISLKMNYACDLLKHGEYSITHIAEACGYDDIYVFSHQFKKYFGVSPSRYIKKYKSSK